MTSARRMQVLRDPRAVRQRVRSWRKRGDRVAFVPTMGALHQGHLSLVQRARKIADRVVASIFVNPTQFAANEDLDAYPRNLKADLKLLRDIPVDLCFSPTARSVYGPEHRTVVRVDQLGDVLEGAYRPEHFAGVTLVVAKLLNIVEPDFLILGQKDAQQAVILETMIRDLDLPVRVVRGKTVREPDGLAMSSRNVYLETRERQAAAVLWRSLKKAKAAVRAGERSAARIKQVVRGEVKREKLVRLEYVEVVHARTLQSLKRLEGRVLVPVAAQVGHTRLIDNIEFSVPGRNA